MDKESQREHKKMWSTPKLGTIVKLALTALGLVTTWHTFLFYLMYNQRRFLYHSYYPQLSRAHVMTPEQVGFMAPYRTVWVDCEDGVRLHAFLFYHDDVGSVVGEGHQQDKQQALKQSKKEKRPTLYWFQGTAGNIGHKLQQANAIYTRCQCNIFLISYRGYGLSNGEPSYRGIQLDTQAGLDYLLRQPEVDPGKIVLFGQSLGGAIALDLLARNRDLIMGCIVENTFTDLITLHRIVFPLFRGLSHMISDPWDNLASLSQVGDRYMPPMLFLSGRQDQLIPPWMMDKLYEKAKSLARSGTQIMKKEFPTGRHIFMDILPGYYDAFEEYFRQFQV